MDSQDRYVCIMGMCLYVHMCAGACGGQELMVNVSFAVCDGYSWL